MLTGTMLHLQLMRPTAAAASKLLWMKRREPQHWERLAHVLLPHDYINWWLTGRYCMEASTLCCAVL